MSLHSPKFCIICIANEDCFLILWYAVIALSQTYKTVLAVCDQRLFTVKHLACLNVMFLPVSIATVSEIFKGTMWLQCCRFQGVSLSCYTPPRPFTHAVSSLRLLSLAPPAGYLQAVQASSVLACIFSIIGIFVFVAQLFTLAKGQRFLISGVFQFFACKYFFFFSYIFIWGCFSLYDVHWCASTLVSMFPSLQACASWSQPPSTQTNSTLMKKVWVVTAIASFWRGSPSLSHSSPPSFTLCYVRRLRSSSSQSLSRTQTWNP